MLAGRFFCTSACLYMSLVTITRKVVDGVRRNIPTGNISSWTRNTRILKQGRNEENVEDHRQLDDFAAHDDFDAPWPLPLCD